MTPLKGNNPLLTCGTDFKSFYLLKYNHSNEYDI